MTILNVWVGRQRALVGVDTAADHPCFKRTAEGIVTSERFEATKLFPLAAIVAVMAGRGEGGLIWSVHLECLMRPGDFDALADAMPEILHAADKRYKKMLPFWKRRRPGGVQLALVGFSPRQGRMVGAVYSRAAAGQPVDRLDLGGEGSEGGSESDDWLAPWEPEQGEAPVPNTTDNMLDLMRRQLAHAPPGAPIGGPLLVAELRPTTIGMRRWCTPGG